MNASAMQMLHDLLSCLDVAALLRAADSAS
jgi:hypothetical protein